MGDSNNNLFAIASQHSSKLSNNLSTWLSSDYLQQSLTKLQLDYSMFTTSSNFFNPSTIMDVFFVNQKAQFLTPQIQYYLNLGTNDFILEAWELTKSPLNIIRSNVDLSFINTPFSATMFSDTYLYSLSTKMIEEMYAVTSPKTDPEKLIEVLPEHQFTFEIFEVISINVDNSLYQHLHLPEFKLYYPEPFIASPSFQHEEL